MRTLIALILCGSFMCTDARAESAADAYRAYVDKAIPESFEVVRTDAQDRELEIFLRNLTSTQGHVSAVSDATILVDALTPLIDSSADLSTADTDTLLQQLLIASQVANVSQSVRFHLGAASAIVLQQDAACSGGFDKYDDSRVVSDYKPNIEDLDGVYVEGGNLIQFVISFFESVWQLVSNEGEQKQIEAQSARLEQNRAKSADYQTFAREACAKLQPIFADQFSAFQLTINESRSWLSALDSAKYDLRRRYIEDTLRRKGVADTAQAVNAAYSPLSAKLASIRDNDLMLSLDTKTRLRARIEADSLSQLSCASSPAPIIAEMESNLSLARVYQLSSADLVSKNLYAAIGSFANRCAGQTKILTRRLRAMVARAPLPRARQHRAQLNLPTTISTNNTAECFGGSGSHSLCNSLLLLSAHQATYSETDGGVCRTSAVMSFQDCESISTSVDPNFRPDAAWSDVRSTVALADHLPGQYSSIRAKLQANQLDQQLNQIKASVANTQALTKDLASSNDTYFRTAVLPSLAKQTDDLKHDERSVLPNLASRMDTPTIDTDAPSFDLPASVSSPPLAKWIGNIPGTVTTTSDFSLLEALWEISAQYSSDLPSADRAALRETLGRFYDSNGVLRHASGLSDQFLTGISSGLSTGQQSLYGQTVRRDLNRSLFAYSVANGPVSRAESLGAADLVLGSDQAFANGGKEDGELLDSQGAQIADAVLGLAPVVGSINDLTQIAFGFVTGSDYAGRPMTASDYALRSAGAIIGLFPTAVLKIGTAVIDRAFIDGASLIRRLRFGESIRPSMAFADEAVFDFAQRVGRWLPNDTTIHYPDYDVAKILDELSVQQRQLYDNIAVGQGSEVWVLDVLGEPKNTTSLSVDGVGKFIPDILDADRRLLGEIKSSKNLTMTDQFRKYIAYCEQNPSFTFELYVYPDTTISSDLEQSLKSISAKIFNIDPKQASGVTPRILN